MPFFNKVYYGNELWRFIFLFGIILATLVLTRILKYILDAYARKLLAKDKVHRGYEIFIRSTMLPLQLILWSAGLYLAHLPLKFAAEGKEGLDIAIMDIWLSACNALFTIAVALFLYKLVDVVEFYLYRWAGRTETKLDDMMVPVIRKALRITIAIIALLFIAQNVLHKDITTLLAGLGVGGLAVAIAARDTIANFFGSVMIFTERPFHIGDLVKIGDYFGTVEEVGLRSSKIRTLEGHLITIPNANVATTAIENISARPFIRKNFSITITYNTPPEKVQRAVDIIKEVISSFPQTSSDENYPPRVYFDNFNDWSLNLLVYYWVKPADWWEYLQTTHNINMEILKRFNEEGIEFAFPTQTVYLNRS